MNNNDDQIYALKKCLFDYLSDTVKNMPIEAIKPMYFEQRSDGYCQAAFFTDKYKFGVLFMVAFYPNDMIVNIYEYPMTKTHSISCEIND